MDELPQPPIPIWQFASHLLDWYRHNKRSLPWRKHPSPYRVWISEVMLQQTQVKTVLPYFDRFIERYPSLETLAQAKETEVLSLWSGLGYYNRARNLHQAAQVVCEKHNGQFPRDYQQAVQLPGIGRYTAGAILSIAYGEPLPILEGNIRRLLSRYLKLENPGILTDPNLWEYISQMVSEPLVRQRISDFNQALMELGALVCTPQHPDCPRCPLAPTCQALKAGLQDKTPIPRRSRPIQELHYLVALVHSQGKYLLTQNLKDKFLRGLWEFPRVEGRPQTNIQKAFQTSYGLKLRVEAVSPPLTHYITFRKLQLHPVRASLLHRIAKGQFLWAKPGQNSLPVPSYVTKLISSTRN